MPNNYISSIADIQCYRETFGLNKLVLDTNLLLLLLIGSFKIDSLAKCKCTQKYNGEDYKLLLQIISFFEKKIVITPHILAEFSNLSKIDIKDPQIVEYIAYVIEQLRGYQEQHAPLIELLNLDIALLARFGFPDIGIIETAKILNAFILTDDGNLSRHADSVGIANCYFQYVRNNSYELSY